MLFFKVQESLGSRVSCFRCNTHRHSCLPLRHFGHLKMLFFKGLEGPGRRVSCFRWLTLRYFEGLKNAIPQVSWDPRLYWTIWCPENASPVELWDPGLMGTRLPVETFIAFWRPENVITQVSWDHRPKAVCWPVNGIVQVSWDSWIKNIWLPFLQIFLYFGGLNKRFPSCR
jgi:hypothetical protein